MSIYPSVVPIQNKDLNWNVAEFRIRVAFFGVGLSWEDL